jgi:molybdopterin/thiamine biosynthesis adenylyltransferase
LSKPVVEDSRVFSDRYDRYRRLNALGAEGLQRLADARFAVVGMGVLGCYITDLLVRLGVKNLRIVDRDVLQSSDLGHQILYDEDDVRRELPKVEAASRRLRSLNSSCKIDAIFIDLNPGNILEVLDSIDIVLDGLDNLAGRFMLNDAALETGVPWIYCSAAGLSGMAMGVPSGGKPCFRCMIPNYTSPGSTLSCDTVGIWLPAAHWAAGQSAWLAIQGLMGNWEHWGELTAMDCFPVGIEIIKVKATPSCPACVGGHRDFLHGDLYPKAFQLCGRDEVTILPVPGRVKDMHKVAEQWDGAGELEATPYFVRWKDDTHQVLIFEDGRVLIRGVQSVDEAQRLWGRLFSRWT